MLDVSQVFSHSFHCSKQRNSDQAPISCAQSSCTFAAIPQLEEYKISLVVKNKLGEETQSYSFNISSRGSTNIWTEFLFTTLWLENEPWMLCVCVSLSAFPVVESVTVSRGVTDATVSWIIKGRLTQLNLLCQVSTDPHGTTEVSLVHQTSSNTCSRLNNSIMFTMCFSLWLS